MANYDKYPNILFSPTITKDIYGKKYKLYKAKFSSIHSLYEYIKSEPTMNPMFNYDPRSINGSTDFAGVPFDEALESLEQPPRDEFQDFLRLSNRLNNNSLDYVEEYESIKSFGGGCIDIPSYVAGNPLCYRTSRSIYTPKFLRIHVALSYFWGTSKDQVLNRALIIASLVNAFEQAGYVVDLNTFELSSKDDEMIYIDVNIKNSDETFNKASLYKSLCYVEFLRRILFRVLETMDVTNDWPDGYGHTCNKDLVVKVLGLNKDDIFFDQPSEMGVEGDSIMKDFSSVLKHLNIEDKIDVKQTKKDFNDNIKRLKKVNNIQ